MTTVNKDEYYVNKSRILGQIKEGAVFIHPTDTIYGIGCDATNEAAVEKVRAAKQRKDLPFNVIAPSREWVRANCEVNEEAEEWLAKLPGPYTIILKLKEDSKVAKNVNPSGDGTIGIRRPDHWISEITNDLDKPIVTTSANITGKNFMTSMDNLDDDVKKKMNLIIYEGEKKGRPSTIVDLARKRGLTKR
ncbi:threonylcarbamoyl-AMP synthase [Candidatus Woesearchaeota archaeon]|nr:threonylcarbamoyl-AMP synthase [Candidatus Woesearchaeota archaeon]MBW2994150.1 threonylcarbamoyl-AMP synthase [Candidatus Woesearchaeota archaeon]